MFSPSHLLDGVGAVLGTLIIGGIIFAESGMLVGFFLPGDTLLITAGIFAAQGKLSLTAILIVTAAAAICGDNLGYHIGKHLGPRLFKRKDGVLFRHEYIERAERFFERFGSKAMLFSHFVPVVRTFVPIVAGVGKMDRTQFFLFDAIGDIAWALVTTMIGYWFGSKIPNIDHYILLAIGLAILFTFSPLVWHLFVNKRFWQSVRTKLNR